jgi:hypothetical protein
MAFGISPPAGAARATPIPANGIGLWPSHPNPPATIIGVFCGSKVVHRVATPSIVTTIENLEK